MLWASGSFSCAGARRKGIAALTVVLAMGALAAIPVAPAVAAPSRRRTDSTGKLSPRLATLATGTGFASPRARAQALSLPATGFGSLVTRPNGRLLVDIRTTDTTAAGVDALRARGAQIVNVSPAYQTVTAAVAPGGLESIASDPSVLYVQEVLAPHVGSLSRAQTHAIGHAVQAQACAPVVSEGNTLMNVGAARATNHVDGSGETVGILSDSFDKATGTATHAAQDVAHGELPGPGNPCGHPTPVTVQQDGSGTGLSDEGRAMAQLVHGLAPGANLAFGTIGNGETAFASQITALRTQSHASVIVDDAFYPNEPFFQDGPVANAASAATAAGVPYFSAAGNANVIVGGHDVASYEAPAYRPATCPSFTNLGYPVLDCHDFDASAGIGSSDSITVAPGGGFDLDLQWAEPRGAVSTDLDAFVVNGSGTIVADSTIDNGAAGQPIEFLSWGNASASSQTVRIVIARFSGAATPRLKFVLIDSGGISAVQRNVSNNGDIVGPGIVGHAGTAGIGTTAAVPYDDSTTAEDFSSRGPVTHYFEPTPSTTPLVSPELVDTPMFAATDGVRTSFFAQQIGGVWRFYGSSAAAPQAAAIGAVLLSKNPLLTPAQVMTALHDTARAVPNNGSPAAVGGGYLDASAALASVTPLPGAPRAVHGSPGDAQVTVSWTAPASDGGIAITGYTVTPYLNGAAQTPLPFNSTATSQVIAGLVDGTAYTFTVTAVDGNGPGPESDQSPAVIVGTPTRPTGVAVTAGGDARATLHWVTPAATNGSTLTGYVITPFRQGVAEAPRTVGVTTTATVTNLLNGYPYTFEVAATSDRGNGEPSVDTAPFTIGLPRQPTNIAATPGNAAAGVTYTAPTPNGTTITSYLIEVYSGSTFVSGQSYSTATKQTVRNLTNGHAYRFRVHAVTSGGGGPESGFTNPVVVGAPTAPFKPTAVAGNGKVALHWTKSANNGAAITKYVVSAVVGGVAQAARTYPGTASSATITGLKNGKTFSYKVKAVNARGSSAQSAAGPVVIGAPGPPTHVTAKAGHNQAVVQWAAPANNGAPITAYTVTPYLNGVAKQAHVFHSASTKHVVTGVAAGNTYTFVVKATNARGTGPPSAHSPAILIN